MRAGWNSTIFWSSWLHERATFRTHRTLRGLLRAHLAVAHADDLDVVLQHIVDAARELVDAQYAAWDDRRRSTRAVRAYRHA